LRRGPAAQPSGILLNGAEGAPSHLPALHVDRGDRKSHSRVGRRSPTGRVPIA